MTILNDLVLSYEVAGTNIFLSLINEARLIFWMLALMSTGWSLILLASRPHSESLVTQIGRHLLFFGFFGGFFLEVFPRTIGSIPGMFMRAGQLATGADTFLNPDSIITAGFGLAVRMLVFTGNFPILTGVSLIVRVFGALVMMIAFLVIAIKVTQLLIEKSIAVLGIGVFLFAFTGGRWTWSVGEGLIRYAIHLGLRLMILMILLDVGKSLVDLWTAQFDGFRFFIGFRTWVGLIVGPVVFAHIAWTIPDRVANQLAQRISFPNPHLS